MPTPKGWRWPATLRAKQEAVRGTPLERLLRGIEPDTNGGCWLWTGTLIKTTGYGQIQVACRGVGAHRLSWELFRGPIPSGLFVCHRCDIRACCNPDHLFLGTHRDNMQDMLAKGRNNPPRGERHSMARLKAEDIPLICERIAAGHSNTAIGRDFGVDQCVINPIRRGRTWRLEVEAWCVREGITLNDPKTRSESPEDANNASGVAA